MGGKHFDTAAADWDQKQRRVELAAAIAAAIRDNLPLNGEMTALEYGCGTGLVGLALAPQLATLTAVDTSEGMLAVLARKLAEKAITNVKPLNLDLVRSSLPEKFDLIFCAMTLHHIQEKDQLLTTFCEMLRAGGILALADLYEEDGSFHGPEADGVSHHGFNPENLAETLKIRGLIQVHSTTIHSIVKTSGSGEQRSYPVFLLSGRKKK